MSSSTRSYAVGYERLGTALLAVPEVTWVGSAGPLRGVARVPADDPVFAGHYPGFPVLPGVYLIELVLQTVRAGYPNRPALRLGSVQRCRFRSPVYPEDEIRIDVSVSDSPAGLTCSAEVSTDRGPAADMRLLFREAS